LSHNTDELKEQSRSFTCESFPLTGNAQILAWCPCGYHVHAPQLLLAHLANILKPLHVGEVPLQHRTTLRINLNLPCDLEPGSLEPEINSADAGEERAECHSLKLIT
jgi:hypothetical protein